MASHLDSEVDRKALASLRESPEATPLLRNAAGHEVVSRETSRYLSLRWRVSHGLMAYHERRSRSLTAERDLPV